MTDRSPGTELRSGLFDEARRLGLAGVGIVRPDPSEHASFYRGWIGQECHGEMAYLARPDAIDRRADLTRTHEDVRSVVVVADDYYRDDGDDEHPSRGVIARYARGSDYHRVLKKKLLGLAEWLDERVDGGVEARAYVDTGPILERELGRRAGLGWFGRNTMLIHPRSGSYFFLGVLLVDVGLEPTEPFAGDHCGTCRACLDACPTGALLGRNEAGAPVIDARLCISYLTIEHRGPIPVQLRPRMGNRVYGCDICQEVCPFNVRFARETTEARYASRGPGELPAGVQPERPGAKRHHLGTRGELGHPGTLSPPLVDLLRTALDEHAWDAFSRGSAIRRAGRAGFARNVCVALGNAGDPAAGPVLHDALDDPDPMVRGHAVWALARVGGREARTRLAEARETEVDPFVVEELERVLEE